MFVKQIDVNAALELARKGIEIKMLIPSPSGDWEDMNPTTLQKLLEGCLFFRQEAAMENPAFTVQTRDQPDDEDPADSPVEEVKEASFGAKKPAAGKTDNSAKRKPVDFGKMVALKKAGWTQAKIATELGVSEATVSTYLKRVEEKDEDKI